MAGKNEVASQVPAVRQMEFRLINPTDEGFLKRIEWNKEELEEAVRAKIASYENVVYTEDSMKQAKADRADLNKLVKAIEERRKQVKAVVNAPYVTFEAEVKEILSLIKEPVKMIDDQVKGFDENQKEEKKEKLLVAYEEVIGNHEQDLPFERVFEAQYLNTTFSLSKATAAVQEKVNTFIQDLQTIEALDSKYMLNVRDVYVSTLNLSKALAENNRLLELEARLEEERRLREEAEAKKREEEARQRAAEEEKARQEAERLKAAEAEIAEREADSADQEEAENNAETTDDKEDENEDSDEEVVDPLMPAPSVTQTPVVEDQKYKMKFCVVGTKEQLVALKQYMIDNHLEFGKVE